MDLLRGIQAAEARVAVIGLGYVGLPLALKVAASGFKTTGIDLSDKVVDGISAGRSPILDVADTDLAAQLDAGNLEVTSNAAVLSQADVIVICVPTPLKDEQPDTSFIEAAAGSIASTLRRGQLVILESTTYPGTTEDLLRGILESSGLKAGVDFFLGFSPERIDPGNDQFQLQDLPKIVGGINEESTELMEAFYGSFINKIVRVSSAKTAEMAKLLENTYRHVNIALANEMAILCHDLSVDIWEVIDAAATKPFGFEPFYPGPGWGGHCIPVDPTYFSWRVRQMGATARFVELAREFNKKMPGYVVQRMAEALNEHGKSLKSAAILVLGVAYKAGVADLRQSPATDIIERATRSGAVVTFHDPYIDEIHLCDQPMTAVQLDPTALKEADLVLVHTAHDCYDWQWIADSSRLILDTRNALQGVRGPIVKL